MDSQQTNELSQTMNSKSSRHIVTVDPPTLINSIFENLIRTADEDGTKLMDASARVIGAIKFGSPPQSVVVCPHAESDGKLTHIVTAATPREQDRPSKGEPPQETRKLFSVDCPDFHLCLFPLNHQSSETGYLYTLNPRIFGGSPCGYKLQLLRSQEEKPSPAIDDHSLLTHQLSFKKYCSFDNHYDSKLIQKIRDTISILDEKECVWEATEKVHGSHFAVSVINDGLDFKLRAAKRSGFLDPDEKFFNYQKIIEKYIEKIEVALLLVQSKDSGVKTDHYSRRNLRWILSWYHYQ